VHDSAQTCGSSEESVRPGCDAWPVGQACIEERRPGEGLVDVLDEDAYHATESRSHGHRRHEDSRRHFAAKGYNDEECADDSGDG